MMTLSLSLHPSLSIIMLPVCKALSQTIHTLYEHLLLSLSSSSLFSSLSQEFSVVLSFPLPESLDIYFHFYKTHCSSLSIKCVFFLSNIIFSHPLFYFNTHFSLSLFLSLSTIHFSIPLLHLFLSNILISFITLFTKPIQ